MAVAILFAREIPTHTGLYGHVWFEEVGHEKQIHSGFGSLSFGNIWFAVDNGAGADDRRNSGTHRSTERSDGDRAAGARSSSRPFWPPGTTWQRAAYRGRSWRTRGGGSGENRPGRGARQPDSRRCVD